MCNEIIQNKIILQLLKNRGIVEKEQIKEFLSSKPQKNYDPFLLSNMEAGVDLIISAIKKGSKICIYGDYDADGVTATVLMLEILGEITKDIGYLIPSRFDEGYGLSKKNIDVIKEQGYDFILTVDCGSTSYEEVEYAKSLGLEILVTDHHNIGSQSLNALVINPKQEGDKYPFKDIAGCGVAFKFAQALAKKGVFPRKKLAAVLDLLAIGTIGDVMPLIDENRTFVKYGLRCIDTNKREGIKALKDLYMQKQKNITSETVSFSIVPPINAPGRMGDATLSVKLLREKDRKKAQVLAMELVETNETRKNIQKDAFELCKDIVEKQYKNDKFLMVKAEDIHEGIAGIVAGKIKETYNRPAVVLTKSGEYLKASGRSIKGVNIYEMLSNYQDKFLRFGGHSGACGFTTDEETYEFVRKDIQKQMETLETANPNMYEEEDMYELVLKPEETNLELANEISKLEPYGNANPKPIFMFANVELANVNFLGDSGQHVAFVILNKSENIRCIMFNYPKEIIKVLRTGRANVVGTIEINYWREKENLQLNVRRIEESNV